MTHPGGGPIVPQPAGAPRPVPTTLTPGARTYFDQAVKDYSDRLLAEAENIEAMEHTGGGPAEITAAHVEEAKWVLVRRLRRAARGGGRLSLLRFGQVAMSAAVGIGAANFKETWGALMCVGGVLLGAIFWISERELSRDV